MRMKDVKILWGRAANRCVFHDCKIELTPDGETNTLGEIAHIVAESPNGPRGNNGDISLEQRNDYSNLILLCPTHHKLIDNNPENWTVEKLQRLKQDHEKWVSDQLNQGRIYIHSIDNSAFLDARKKEWFNFAKDYVWVISSITPLDISEDAIDPLNSTLLQVINSLSLPKEISNNSTTHRYHTRPNEHGVINEDPRNIKDGSGHQLQIFRNGHCEFLICLEGSTRQITEAARKDYPEELIDKKILGYTNIAKCFDCQIQGLKKLWDNGLPFNDMLINAVITNTNSTRLYSSEAEWGKHIFGFTVSSKTLAYSNVINKKLDSTSVFELVIKRFINHFGLIINSVYDENRKLIRPRLLFN